MANAIKNLHIFLEYCSNSPGIYTFLGPIMPLSGFAIPTVRSQCDGEPEVQKNLSIQNQQAVTANPEIIIWNKNSFLSTK